jgi:hypothetical protein
LIRQHLLARYQKLFMQHGVLHQVAKKAPVNKNRRRVSHYFSQQAREDFLACHARRHHL